MVSSAHNVCPKGYYVAIVSTIAENEANHHLELEPGFQRLGKIEETFMGPPIPLYEPIDSGVEDNIYISKSYDATSHFETTTGKFVIFTSNTKASRTRQLILVPDDIRDIYRRAEGHELVVDGLREGTTLVGEQ